MEKVIRITTEAELQINTKDGIVTLVWIKLDTEGHTEYIMPELDNEDKKRLKEFAKKVINEN